MPDSLLQLTQSPQTLAIGEKIFPVLAALIGGGLVTLIVDLIRNFKKDRKIRHLIKFEIKMNLDIIKSDYIKQFPWISHKIISSFYDANSIEVISSFDNKIAERVLEFYIYLELLRVRHAENEDVYILNKEGKYDAAKMLETGIGKAKQEIRDKLITMGEEIVGKKKS
ncbi:MAG: hypothetical protein HY088_03575 [Ignavibacteriales bacterium]|nr:hypothetical protein [Ignavibacteriales bacterium]